ncbi:MAG: vWA domain-containing protein [Myxococcales bacterium]|jgi:hypothetical protein
MRSSSFGHATVACLCALSLVACGGGDPTRNPSGSPSGSGGTGGASDGAGGATGGTGGGFDNSGGTGGGTATGGGGTGGVSLPDGGTTIDPNDCGGGIVEPEVIEVEVEVEVTRPAPVAIYIMLDVSGSMVLLWPGAVQAITDFVGDPASEGLDVALGLFPPAIGLDQCAAASYDPPLVPMGRLPGHATNITGALPPIPIGAGTPISGALDGATQFCQNFTPADPADAGEECVVLFITDGQPADCDTVPANIVSIAQNGGVPVYTIALQGVTDLTLFNDIADATATDCDPAGPNSACDLTSGASFVDALNSIRDTIVEIETRIETEVQPLPCEWGLPEADANRGFDKNEVNVLLQSADGTSSETFARVASEDDCGDNAAAWYYDDLESPGRILACPGTCDVIEATTGGSVSIQLGCPTVVLE